LTKRLFPLFPRVIKKWRKIKSLISYFFIYLFQSCSTCVMSSSLFCIFVNTSSFEDLSIFSLSFCFYYFLPKYLQIYLPFHIFFVIVFFFLSFLSFFSFSFSFFFSFFLSFLFFSFHFFSFSFYFLRHSNSS
jgi:hypothetical protein